MALVIYCRPLDARLEDIGDHRTETGFWESLHLTQRSGGRSACGESASARRSHDLNVQRSSGGQSGDAAASGGVSSYSGRLPTCVHVRARACSCVREFLFQRFVMQPLNVMSVTRARSCLARLTGRAQRVRGDGELLLCTLGQTLL